MRIYIKEGENHHRFWIPIPVGLCSIVITVVPGSVYEKYVNQSLSKADIKKLLHIIRETSREFKGLEIVSVSSSDGTRVQIIL